jgi:hypothetical protein
VETKADTVRRDAFDLDCDALEAASTSTKAVGAALADAGLFGEGIDAENDAKKVGDVGGIEGLLPSGVCLVRSDLFGARILSFACCLRSSLGLLPSATICCFRNVRNDLNLVWIPGCGSR